MKLRDLPLALGWQKKAPQVYPFEVTTFDLPDEGSIRFARWQHPGETPKVVTQESVRALRTFLREGDVAIDIGAHTGDSTLPIALAVGARGLVIALEPNPYVFKVLEANAALNPEKANISPLMFAAMPTDGQFDFEYSDEGYCNGGFHDKIARWRHGHFHRLRVEGRNLSKYLLAHTPDVLSRLRYIKIDTEGFDSSVFESLREVIVHTRPFIKSEIYQLMQNQDRDAYDDALRRLGYRLFKCEGETEYCRQELRVGDLKRYKHFDVFAAPWEALENQRI